MTNKEINELRQRIHLITITQYPTHSVTAIQAITNAVLAHVLTKRHISENTIEAAYEAITRTDDDTRHTHKRRPPPK